MKSNSMTVIAVALLLVLGMAFTAIADGIPMCSCSRTCSSGWSLSCSLTGPCPCDSGCKSYEGAWCTCGNLPVGS